MDSQQSTDPEVVSAAHWFWWIAGLSVVNTVLFYAGSETTFVVGLGLTTVASALLPQAVGIAVVVATLAFYGYIGYVAARGKAWAFIVGLAVYVVDALFFIYAQLWMAVAFHGLAIFFILKGLMKIRGKAAAPAA